MARSRRRKWIDQQSISPSGRRTSYDLAKYLVSLLPESIAAEAHRKVYSLWLKRAPICSLEELQGAWEYLLDRVAAAARA